MKLLPKFEVGFGYFQTWGTACRFRHWVHFASEFWKEPASWSSLASLHNVLQSSGKQTLVEEIVVERLITYLQLPVMIRVRSPFRNHFPSRDTSLEDIELSPFSWVR